MPVKKTTDSQSVAADVNEIFFGYNLTNNWDDFEDSEKVQTELDERSKRLSKEEVNDQEGRAKDMAKTTFEWMKK